MQPAHEVLATPLILATIASFLAPARIVRSNSHLRELIDLVRELRVLYRLYTVDTRYVTRQAVLTDSASPFRRRFSAAPPLERVVVQIASARCRMLLLLTEFQGNFSSYSEKRVPLHEVTLPRARAVAIRVNDLLWETVQPKCMLEAVASGADVNMVRRNEAPLLVYIAKNCHRPKALLWLRAALRAGALPDCQDADGRTALLWLMKSVSGSNEKVSQMARVLLLAGASFDLKDHWGKTARDWAYRRGRQQILGDSAAQHTLGITIPTTTFNQ